MARKPPIVLTDEQLEQLAGDETPQTEGERDLERAGQDADRDVIAALLELEGASDARWRVHRVLPVDNAGFVCEMNSAELTLATIAARCGPGKYRVNGLDAKGRYIGQRSITIAKPADNPIRDVSGGNSTVADMLAIMREERARSKDDAFKWAQLIVPCLVPILPTIFSRKETSLAELTTALANMKQLAGGDSSQLGRVEEFAKMVEVVKSITGDGNDKGSTWVDLIRDGVKELAPVAQAALMRVPPQPVARPTIANPRPAPPDGLAVPPPEFVQPAQPEVENPMLKLLQWFRAQLEVLVLKAAKNSDPGLYAEYLADNFPEGLDPQMLASLLTRDDWWPSLVQFYGPVEPYMGWFTELRKELLDMISEAQVARPAPTDIEVMQRDAGEIAHE